MIILPAIDLFGGQAVRLYQGDYNQMTVYDADPLHTVAQFEAAGATHLHLVDLEGPRPARPPTCPPSSGSPPRPASSWRWGAASAKDGHRPPVPGGRGQPGDFGHRRRHRPGLHRPGGGPVRRQDRRGGRPEGRQGGHQKVGWRPARTPGRPSLTRCKPWGCTMICTDISRDGAMEGDQPGPLPHPGPAVFYGHHRLGRRVLPGGHPGLEGGRGWPGPSSARPTTGAIDLAQAIALGKGEEL